MQVTEQHVIERKGPRFAAIETTAFKSKNLYNAAWYVPLTKPKGERFLTKASSQ